MLKGFTPIPVPHKGKPPSEFPTINISKTGVRLSPEAVRQLGNVKFAVFYINRELRTLAVKGSKIRTRDAYHILASDKPQSQTRTIVSSALQKEVMSLFDGNLETSLYRVIGTPDKDEKGILYFDFKRVQEVSRRKVRNASGTAI